MGPISRASLVKIERAGVKFDAALLEELQGIREILNKMSGTHEFDKETFNERVDQVEGRLSELERRARPPG